MELWIRSQNRESLLKVEKIFYFNTCPEMESTGRNVILKKEWIGEKNCIELGEYPTKERALEVLDEIQKILMPPITVLVNKEFAREDMKTITNEDVVFVRNDAEVKPLYDDYVYEMPKE